MTPEKFHSILWKLNGIKENDKIQVDILGGSFIGILLEKIVRWEVLSTGQDTGNNPTYLKIRTVDIDNPDDHEEIISIQKIHDLKLIEKAN